MKLNQPIRREGGDIDEISLRKPNTGELRGVKLLDLLQLDVSALIMLLPRITTPTLTPQDIANISPDDLLAIGAEVQSFFVISPASQST